MMKISMVNTDVLWSKPWCHGVMYMGCHDDHPPRTAIIQVELLTMAPWHIWMCLKPGELSNQHGNMYIYICVYICVYIYMYIYIYVYYIHKIINMIRPYDIKPLFYGDETSSLNIIFAYARIIMLNMMKIHDIPMLFLGISMGLLWDDYGIFIVFP